ncbi:MAG TPA: sugar kinase [Desulfuromonas sp.]|nr:sugar kinase [Desulfuromonas sp.]
MTERLSENKIVLVTRKTRLDELIVRFNTELQARFYVEHLGADFSDYQDEDRCYKGALRATQTILARLGRVQVVDRAFIPNFLFGPNDTVVALGQDGLVANVLKYLDGQPLLGVNPDPARWEGVLLPFAVGELGEVVPAVFKQQRPIRQVTIAKAALNTGEVLYGVNDLFIGPKSHTSARYQLKIGARAESHSSSGIIVSTGLGSSGWFRSILAGASGIAANLAGGKPQTPQKSERKMPWDADYLYFSVREPWPSKTSSAQITFGKITPKEPLQLTSQMPEHGVIFSDGIEHDFLAFNAGTLATITLADKKGQLVV